MDKSRFVPEDKGRLLSAFLGEYFLKYIEYDFTADLEEKLDKVSAGELDWKVLLREFWKDFQAAIASVGDLRIGQVLDALNETLGPAILPGAGGRRRSRALPRLRLGAAQPEGQQVRRLHRLLQLPGVPLHPAPWARRRAATPRPKAATGELGLDPDTNRKVFLRHGRFGPYVELELEPDADKKAKPKRSSLPKGWAAATLDLEQGDSSVEPPREVGLHPDDGQPIVANLGRYGPYVAHNGTYANLDSAEGGVRGRRQPRGDPHRRETRRRRAGRGRPIRSGGAEGAGSPSRQRRSDPASSPAATAPMSTPGKINANVPKTTDPRRPDDRGGDQAARRTRRQGRRWEAREGRRQACEGSQAGSKGQGAKRSAQG